MVVGGREGHPETPEDLMIRWFASSPSGTRRIRAAARPGALTPAFVTDPGRNRRRDPERRALVAAMLTAIDDPDERDAFLRNVRSQPRELLPR